MAVKQWLARGMRRAGRLRWGVALLGGLAFWLPDVAYHYCVRVSDPSLLAITLLTFGMPLAVVTLYLLIGAWVKSSPQSIGLSMALGIWLLGPTMIMAGWTFAGSGFKSSGPVVNVILIIFLTLVFPLTLLLAGLDFTVLGLLLATLSLVFLHRLREKGHRLLPPEEGQQVAQP